MNLFYYVFPTNLVAGTGTGRVAVEIIQGMTARTGTKVKALCARPDFERNLDALSDRLRNVEFVSFRRPFRKQQLGWMLSNKPPAEAYWDQAELVHSPSEAFVPTCRAASVVTLHDAAFFDEGAHEQNAAYYLQRLKYTFLFRKLLRHTDAFHTVSQFSAERFTHHFPGIADRLTVIPNGVADIFFDEKRAMSASGDPFGFEGRPYVLLPRGLVYRKNAELVLETWPELAALFPDILLVVPSQNTPSYVERARLISDRIRVLGYVSDGELAALYRGASAVWFPSRYEGFGLPVLEAMACGAPVIAADTTSLPEVAGDAAILVSPDDRNAQIAAISSVLTENTLAGELSKKGRQRAVGFRWKNSISALFELYGRLI